MSRCQLILITFCSTFIAACFGGCLGDQFLDNPDASSDGDSDSDSDSDSDGDTDTDGDSDGDVDTGSEVEDDHDYTEKNYEGWEEADDSYGPGTNGKTLDDGHSGWGKPRCFECHGPGKDKGGKTLPEIGHNPAMQLWSWSCARGFPGGECHGHGINTDFQFNHNGASDFLLCTRSECHDIYDAGTNERENHGFMEAPDAFCNACHNVNWSAWPEEI